MKWSFTLENINQVANEFWNATAGKTVFAFHGQMGAGKTTFIRVLCNAMGIKDMVGSPTFSLVNEYEYYPVATGKEGTKKTLFHLDLYRIKTEEEAVRVEWKMCCIAVISAW
jgi:tRNA threonylcarbamoyladenosine biosynthesis protein TsaE